MHEVDLLARIAEYFFFNLDCIIGVTRSRITTDMHILILHGFTRSRIIVSKCFLHGFG